MEVKLQQSDKLKWRQYQDLAGCPCPWHYSSLKWILLASISLWLSSSPRVSSLHKSILHLCALVLHPLSPLLCPWPILLFFSSISVQLFFLQNPQFQSSSQPPMCPISSLHYSCLSATSQIWQFCLCIKALQTFPSSNTIIIFSIIKMISCPLLSHTGSLHLPVWAAPCHSFPSFSHSDI